MDFFIDPLEAFWRFKCICAATFGISGYNLLNKNRLQCNNCGAEFDVSSLKEVVTSFIGFKRNLTNAVTNSNISAIWIPGVKNKYAVEED